MSHLFYIKTISLDYICSFPSCLKLILFGWIKAIRWKKHICSLDSLDD
jgi:hypothetical protein